MPKLEAPLDLSQGVKGVGLQILDAAAGGAHGDRATFVPLEVAGEALRSVRGHYCGRVPGRCVRDRRGRYPQVGTSALS